MIWLHPPLPSASWHSFSILLYVASSILTEGGGGVEGGAKSYDRDKQTL